MHATSLSSGGPSSALFVLCLTCKACSHVRLARQEFMFALNRHSAWASFLDAWQATGNPVYARAFDARVADWVAHNLPGPARREDANTTWRTLEAGIRAGGSWPTSFFGFQAAAGLRASTRCSMVAALGEHGRYLHEFGDAGNSNWRSMQ